jgi:hypothetical protein
MQPYFAQGWFEVLINQNNVYVQNILRKQIILTNYILTTQDLVEDG